LTRCGRRLCGAAAEGEEQFSATALMWGTGWVGSRRGPGFNHYRLIWTCNISQFRRCWVQTKPTRRRLRRLLALSRERLDEAEAVGGGRAALDVNVGCSDCSLFWRRSENFSRKASPAIKCNDFIVRIARLQAGVKTVNRHAGFELEVRPCPNREGYFRSWIMRDGHPVSWTMRDGHPVPFPLDSYPSVAEAHAAGERELSLIRERCAPPVGLTIKMGLLMLGTIWFPHLFRIPGHEARKRWYTRTIFRMSKAERERTLLVIRRLVIRR
jgi:hypothetical protein